MVLASLNKTMILCKVKEILMKIKIIKAFRDNCWYSNRIGEVFNVSYIRKFDNCYMVIDDDKLNYGGQLSYVCQEDCVEISDEEVKPQCCDCHRNNTDNGNYCRGEEEICHEFTKNKFKGDKNG